MGIEREPWAAQYEGNGKWCLYYKTPPFRMIDGGCFSMSVPALRLTPEIGDQEKTATDIARLLNAFPFILSALPDLIECAETMAAECRISGKRGHAEMWQTYADRGRAALVKGEGLS